MMVSYEQECLDRAENALTAAYTKIHRYELALAIIESLVAEHVTLPADVRVDKIRRYLREASNELLRK